MEQEQQNPRILTLKPFKIQLLEGLHRQILVIKTESEEDGERLAKYLQQFSPDTSLMESQEKLYLFIPYTQQLDKYISSLIDFLATIQKGISTNLNFRKHLSLPKLLDAAEDLFGERIAISSNSMIDPTVLLAHIAMAWTEDHEALHPNRIIFIRLRDSYPPADCYLQNPLAYLPNDFLFNAGLLSDISSEKIGMPAAPAYEDQEHTPLSTSPSEGKDQFKDFYNYIASLSPAMRSLIGPITFKLTGSLVYAISDTPEHLQALESRLSSTLNRMSELRFYSNIIFITHDEYLKLEEVIK